MSSETLSVSILGKLYQVICPAEESEDLLQAAAELDRRMRDIREIDSVIGVERIAVMAALNLADEVLKTRRDLDQRDKPLLEEMHQRIDKIIS
ncbi:MAG: cell division protein ZapA [Cellvibrionaceae bacterium]|nr:cell division protein ZapA [Cellvibrionaceae bacterium]